MLQRYTVLFAAQSILALADRIEAELGWSFLHNVQAYQTDGDKTTAFEICEQLRWQAPAAVFVPTGTGTNLFGLWQGFVLFKELGFIDTLPRMFAVQPVGADSLVAAWEAHRDIPIVMDSTKPNLAPPICPRISGYHAYKAIRESGVGILTSHGLKNSLALAQVFPPHTHVEETWEALGGYLEST